MNTAGFIAELLRAVPPTPPRCGVGGTVESAANMAVPSEPAVPPHGIVDARVAVAQQGPEVMFRLLETTSVSIGIDPAPVVQQARAWQYCQADIDEILSWSPCTVERHVRLLASEVMEGISP